MIHLARHTTFLLIFISTLIATSAFASSNEQLKTQLLKAIQSFEEGDFDSSLVQLNQVLNDALQTNDHIIIAQTKLNFGVLHYVLNDNEKALNYYFETLEYAQKHDLKKLYNSIYNNIGIIYINNHQVNKAKEYFNKALKISRELNEQYKTGINLVNLANLESDEANFENAVNYLQEAEIIYTALKNTQRLSDIQSTYGQIFFKQEKYIKAKQYNIAAYNMQKSIGDPHYLSIFSINLANTYYQLNNYDSALFYANICLDLSLNMMHKESILNSYTLIGKIYDQQGKYKQASNHFQKGLTWSDSLMREKSQKWISEMQMKYDFSKKVQAIDFLERKNKLFRIIWLMSVAIFVIVIVFILYSHKARNIKEKQKMALLESERKMNQLEFQKSDAENKCLLEEMKANEEVNRIKQEQLKQALDHKNRELASNALHVINKNSILSDIQNQIKTIECDDKNSTTAKIKNITQLIKSNINLDSDWDSFKLHFEEVHGNFFDKIQQDFSSLTQGDLRLCSYLLINLNPKEIAQILNISPDSIRKRKQRLREKLGLNKDTDLLEFLNRYKA